MNPKAVGLTAIDPPFNKNRDFHATPCSLARGAGFEDRWRWDEDVHEERVDQIQDDWPGVWAVTEAARVASGEDVAAFPYRLGVRLMEMRPPPGAPTDLKQVMRRIMPKRYRCARRVGSGVAGGALVKPTGSSP